MNEYMKRSLASIALCLTLVLPAVSWATEAEDAAKASAAAVVDATAAAAKAQKAANEAIAAADQAKKAADPNARRDAAPPKDSTEPPLPSTGAWTLGGVSAFFLISVFVSFTKLRKDPNWKLSDALSEKADPTTVPPTPPIASSSRLIAFMGMLAMLSVFLGFGLYMLWALFTGDFTKLDTNVKSAGTYLLYGSALYAPYAFNQIKEAMKG